MKLRLTESPTFFRESKLPSKRVKVVARAERLPVGKTIGTGVVCVLMVPPESATQPSKMLPEPMCTKCPWASKRKEPSRVKRTWSPFWTAKNPLPKIAKSVGIPVGVKVPCAIRVAMALTNTPVPTCNGLEPPTLEMGAVDARSV